MVSLDYHSIKSLSPELMKKLDPITLVDVEIEDLEPTVPISYLRCDPYSYDDGLEGGRRILLQTRLSLPLTVYFPSWYSPDYPDEDYGALDRRGLLEACIEQRVEVVYEAPPVSWQLDSKFSRHFTEKMKGERRKKGGST